jgi:hypothetical protein
MAFIPDVRLDFDSLLTPCNDVVMPDRKLKMVRFIGCAPNTMYCDAVVSRTTDKLDRGTNDRRKRTPKEKK